MSKHNRPFVFKQFAVEHCHSSMKVGIDAVVLGAWVNIPETAKRVMDVGCGCGVISLMVAQRFPEVRIKGIDIDYNSIRESKSNFKNSPWRDRIEAETKNFNEIDDKYDYIISNPPYFEDGLKDTNSVRLTARHQGELSPVNLIKKGAELLNEHGKIGLVFPYLQVNEIFEKLKEVKLKPIRMLLMAGNNQLEFKRCFIEFEKTEIKWNTGNKKDELQKITEYIYVKNEYGEYSEQYRNLCKDFYLKF